MQMMRIDKESKTQVDTFHWATDYSIKSKDFLSTRNQKMGRLG